MKRPLHAGSILAAVVLILTSMGLVAISGIHRVAQATALEHAQTAADPQTRGAAFHPGAESALVRSSVGRSVGAVVVLTSLGLLGALLLYHQLTSRLLQPLQGITASLRRAGGGDLSVRVPPQGSREMDRLAAASNRLIANVVRTIEGLRQRAQTDRQLATQIIESYVSAVVALNEDGQVLLANAAARDLLTGASGAKLLDHLKEALSKQDACVSQGDRIYRIEPLAPERSGRFPGRVVALLPEPNATATDTQTPSGGP